MFVCRRTLVDVLGGSLVMSRVLFKIAAIFSKTERLVGFFCIVLGNRCAQWRSMIFITDTTGVLNRCLCSSLTDIVKKTYTS